MSIQQNMVKGYHMLAPTLGAPVKSFRWTRAGGGAETVQFEGSYADMKAKGLGLTYDFDTIEITQKGNDEWYVLTASQHDPLPQVTCEVVGGHMTQMKAYNAKLRFILAEIGVPFDQDAPTDKTTEVIGNFIREVNKMKSMQGYTYQTALAECRNIMLQAGVSAGDTEIWAKKIFDDLALNGEQFMQVTYHFRRTVVMPERVFWDTDLRPWYAYVNYIHTEADLRFAEGIPETPGGWYFQLPKQVRYPTLPGEWLKMAPRIRITYGHKRELTSEYIFADVWSRLLYPVVGE
jgi:hypothetical protein